MNFDVRASEACYELASHTEDSSELDGKQTCEVPESCEN